MKATLPVRALFGLIAVLPCHAQRTPSPPPPGIGTFDVFTAYRLPALKDGAGAPLELSRLQFQAGARALSLGITSRSAPDAWRAAAALLGARPFGVQPMPRRDKAAVALTLPQLNQMLADPSIARVRVGTAELQLDQPIDIGRSGVLLDLNGVSVSTKNAMPWMIRIHDSSAVSVCGGDFSAGDSAILIQNSRAVEVSGAKFHSLTGAGIVVTNSSLVHIADNRFTGLALAPVVLHRGTTKSLVESNVMQDNVGTSNMAAGVLLTDREADISSGPRAILSPDAYWPILQLLSARLHPPTDNVIFANTVANNRSSGIYSDGGMRNVIVSNDIRGNAKEGLCLDNGSAANVVAGNTLTQNGQRWGESDEILNREFIAAAGRLADGTPTAKVPAMSIDNSLYNIVAANKLEQNYGGGIKMVRTGYFNVVGLNLLLNNNEGEGPTYHFFGIELGAAGADIPAPEQDFTGSRGNIVFSNLIRGSHYSGIFMAPGSDLNDIFDNTIMDATHFALESAAVMNNSSLNNLTTVPSVNIASGLDPANLK